MLVQIPVDRYAYSEISGSPIPGRSVRLFQRKRNGLFRMDIMILIPFQAFAYASFMGLTRNQDHEEKQTRGRFISLYRFKRNG